MNIINVDALRDNCEHVACSLKGIREAGHGNYHTPFQTKYHLGDRFVHPCGITGIITTISETGVYSLHFVETESGRVIDTALKSAWYTDSELDKFVETLDIQYAWNYI